LDNQPIHKRNSTTWFACIVAAWCLLSGSGCTQYFLEDLTSHSPEGGFWNDTRHRMKLLFTPMNPYEVLQHSTDGDMRARAYRVVKEQGGIMGGDQESQNKLLFLMMKGAREEKDSICRLAALERLGEFKDPRVKRFFLESMNDKKPVLYADPDPLVRAKALETLAHFDDPTVVPTLARAMNDPHPDASLVAIREMKRFRTPEATAALLDRLRTEEARKVRERNVALQHEIGDSLQAMTGQKLPPKAQAWEEYLVRGKVQDPPKEENSLIKLTTWFDKK
jgi:hypothetical protein